jgi:hypothetical protein
MAAFNVLVQWHELRPNAYGFVPLSIADLVCNILDFLGSLKDWQQSQKFFWLEAGRCQKITGFVFSRH